jgi:hypothetical protein
MTRRNKLQARITDFLIKHLTKEHRGYNQRFPNDLTKMTRTMRPGDVVLVEGSQRVSEVIKYLTQSCWSHAALYVGNTLMKHGDATSAALLQEYGDDSYSMLVEANAESGVIAVPLSKYKDHNIRVCRPINLRPGDLNTVLQTVIGQIGVPYDVRHIVDLLRYFFPVSLIPKRFRRRALESSGEFSHQVICSAQIAMAFQKVRYPIQPHVIPLDGSSNGDGRLLAGWGWLPGRRENGGVLESYKRGVFTPANPKLVTPRDFDLSPYFEIVKFHMRSRADFDYKKILWSGNSLAASPLERADVEGDGAQIVASQTAKGSA